MGNLQGGEEPTRKGDPGLETQRKSSNPCRQKNTSTVRQILRSGPSRTGLAAGVILFSAGAKLLSHGNSRWGTSGTDTLQVLTQTLPMAENSHSPDHPNAEEPNGPHRSAHSDLPPPLPSPPEGWSYTHSNEPQFSDSPTLRDLLKHPKEFRVWLSSLSLGPDDLRLAHDAILALSGSGSNSEAVQELIPEMRQTLLLSSIEALGNSNLPQAQDALANLYIQMIESKSTQAGSIASALLSEVVPQPRTDSKSFQLFVGIASDPSHPHYAQAIGTLAVVLTGHPDLEAKTLARLSPQAVQDIQNARTNLASLPSGDPVSHQLRQHGH